MAEAGTIIDSFLVEVGLDPKKFEAGRKKVSEDFKKMKDDAGKTGKGVEESAKKMLGSVSDLRSEVLRMTLAFAGATSIMGFAKSLTDSDASAGRLAGNLGMLSQEISAWRGAVQGVGGDAKEADSALKAMSQAYWDFQLTGNTKNAADFRALGVTPGVLSQGPAAALLRISESADKMGRPEFAARLNRLGFSEGTINLLEQGRREVEKILDEQRKINPVTDENTRRAREFDKSLADLSNTIKGAARPMVSGLLAIMQDLTGDTKKASDATNEMADALIPVAVLAAAAGAPFVALAAAIGAVVLKWKELKQSWAGAEKWWDGITGSWGSQSAHDFVYANIDRMNKESSAGNAPGGGRRVAPSPVASGIMASMTNRVLSTGTGGTDPEIYRALAAKYGPEVAAGITAGIKAEGGSTGWASHGAFGIGQWRGKRRDELLRRYGRAPTKAQQVAFMMEELEGGDRGGASVLRQKDRYSALNAYIRNFMRPAAGWETVSDLQRGNAALRGLQGGRGGGGTNVNIGTMTINTRATDADGIARDIRQSIGRRVVINQANGGLH